MNSLSTVNNFHKKKSISLMPSRLPSPYRKKVSPSCNGVVDDVQCKKPAVEKYSVIKNVIQDEGKLQSKSKNFRAKSAKNDDYSYKTPFIEQANAEVALMLQNLRSYDDEKWSMKLREKELKNKEDNFIALEKNWQNTIKTLQDKIEELTNAQNSSTNRNVSTEEKECDCNLCIKMETQQSQNTIETLRNNVEKSRKECRKIINEWEKYKIRVNSLIAAKESEIKLLKKNSNLTEDVKIILEENEKLRIEREDIERNMNYLRVENDEMRIAIQELELRSFTAERLFSGLRDALREERMAKNKTEKECLELNTQIKYLRQETDDTIAKLRLTLLEKEAPLKIKNGDESLPTNNNTDVMKAVASENNINEIDDMKIKHLTQTLMETQTSIEMLLSDNLQRRLMNKIEPSGKTEIADICCNDCFTESKKSSKRGTTKITDYIFKIPVITVTIFVYMLGLHLLAINNSRFFANPYEV